MESSGEKTDSRTKSPTIPDLFPNVTAEQLAEIEETLRNYAAIAWRIAERLEREEDQRFDGRTKPS